MIDRLAALLKRLGSHDEDSFFEIAWLKLTGNERRVSPTGEWIWSASTGFIAGCLTVLLFPELLLRPTWLQIANLLVAPLVVGVLVERWRAWRESRRPFHWEVFGHAAAFCLVFALTRLLFTD